MKSLKVLVSAMVMPLVLTAVVGSAIAAGSSVTCMGSTALQPLVDQAATQYMAKHSADKILVQGGGSGTGLTQVLAGACDIGNSDIYAEDKAGIDAKQLVDHKVCVIGFAAVVNKGITIENLSEKQLIDVFTGKVTNWKEVGGPNVKVVIVNRPASSGTRATFRKYALGGADEAAGLALTEDSSGTVRKTISDTPGSIGYLAFSYLDDSVRALKFGGVAPVNDNIENGKYAIWSYEHMYTKGAATGLAKDFLAYMQTADVQKTLVPTMGYIPISDMKVSR